MHFPGGAQRKSATENIQREDLTVFETIETVVDFVDAELTEDREYTSMGKNPVERLKTLLGKLDLVRRSKQRGSEISDDAKSLSHKFVGQVEKIFNNRNFSISLGTVKFFYEKAGHRDLSRLLLIHDRQASHKSSDHTRYSWRSAIADCWQIARYL